MRKGGFTLIELLIVVAIIAILASIAFVALDPLTRFRDSRDSARWQDVTALAGAISVNQVDNGGDYLSAIQDMNNNEVYMISAEIANGCDDQNLHCDTNVADDNNCVDLSALVIGGYLGEIPVSPEGDGTWTSSTSGYTLEKNSNGTVTVRSCESENSIEIFTIR